jgi:hypothetical protein
VNFTKEVIDSELPVTVKRALLRYDFKFPGRLSDISDERKSGFMGRDDDGMWVYLKAGWCSDPELHCIHEWSAGNLISALKSIRPCSCEHCTGEKS